MTKAFLPDRIRVCSVSGCNQSPKARGLCATHDYRLRRHGDVNGGRSRASPGEPQRWIKEHVNYQGDDCLPWPFQRAANGYAVVRDSQGRKLIASRVMCREAHGEPPSDQHEAAHACGNGHLACMNQRHLRWATGHENQLDRIAHGTDCRGLKNPAAKLTESDVLAIRRMIAKGERQTVVADAYGISQAQVWAIKERQAWRHV